MTARMQKRAGDPPRLVYIVTHPVSADLLLRGQLAFMKNAGFHVTVIAAPGAELERVREREGVETIAVPMERNPNPPRDLVSLRDLLSVLRRAKPDIVNASTPKAGLLGSLAARMLRVPVRIYLLRGLRLETARGRLRTILGATERIAASSAKDVVCVSESLKRAAVDGGYVPAAKALVLGAGSSNGVDTHRFQRTDALRAEGARLLAPLGITDAHRIVAFVGRLAVDKGVDDLLRAFEHVRASHRDTKLLLLGGDLADEQIDPDLRRRVASAADVITTPAIADLAPYFARMDVLAFPSLREGFPNVALEAACAAVPIVGFRSTGVIDAIVDGVTGRLVAQHDVSALGKGLIAYLGDPALRAAHGRAARERAERCFRRDVVWRAWLDFYRTRLDAV